MCAQYHVGQHGPLQTQHTTALFVCIVKQLRVCATGYYIALHAIITDSLSQNYHILSIINSMWLTRLY